MSALRRSSSYRSIFLPPVVIVRGVIIEALRSKQTAPISLTHTDWYVNELPRGAAYQVLFKRTK